MQILRFLAFLVLYCDAAWDEIYCWPPTRIVENVSRPCSEVMKDDPEVLRAENIWGNGSPIVFKLGKYQSVHFCWQHGSSSSLCDETMFFFATDSQGVLLGFAKKMEHGHGMAGPTIISVLKPWKIQR